MYWTIESSLQAILKSRSFATFTHLTSQALRKMLELFTKKSQKLKTKKLPLFIFFTQMLSTESTWGSVYIRRADTGSWRGCRGYRSYNNLSTRCPWYAHNISIQSYVLCLRLVLYLDVWEWSGRFLQLKWGLWQVNSLAGLLQLLLILLLVKLLHDLSDILLHLLVHLLLFFLRLRMKNHYFQLIKKDFVKLTEIFAPCLEAKAWLCIALETTIWGWPPADDTTIGNCIGLASKTCNPDIRLLPPCPVFKAWMTVWVDWIGITPPEEAAIRKLFCWPWSPLWVPVLTEIPPLPVEVLTCGRGPVRTKVGCWLPAVTIDETVAGIFDWVEPGASAVTLWTPWVNLIWLDISGVRVRMLLTEPSTVLEPPARDRFEADTTYRRKFQLAMEMPLVWIGFTWYFSWEPWPIDPAGMTRVKCWPSEVPGFGITKVAVPTFPLWTDVGPCLWVPEAGPWGARLTPRARPEELWVSWRPGCPPLIACCSWWTVIVAGILIVVVPPDGWCWTSCRDGICWPDRPWPFCPAAGWKIRRKNI